MLQQLTLNEFLSLAENAKQVAVFCEIEMRKLTPTQVFEILSDEMQTGVMLESGLQRENSGQHSFLAFEPISELRADYTDKNDIFALLRTRKAEMALGNTVGFMTYDAVRFFEDIPDRHIAEKNLPDMIFKFYRVTLMFDHNKQTVLINMIADTDTRNNLEKIYHETQGKIAKLITRISHISEKIIAPIVKKHVSDIKIDINDNEFMQLVERAKNYIIQGDAFQIVLSRCFKRDYTATPFEIYCALRKISPSPYMFYFPIDDSVIVGASPERMIRVHNNEVTINPIAGTHRRTAEDNDEEIADALLSDKKELAEHTMLVDLARNDIGAVCQPGSVKLSEFLKVRHYSHVSHITSVVTGRLRENLDALDVLATVFPAGTLSGAPKIRAMQIIDELETSRRGIYGGMIFRFDYQGNFDSCIAIRMAVLKNGVATVRAGAGIVYDSDARAEAEETKQKSKAMLDAITLAHEELV